MLYLTLLIAIGFYGVLYFFWILVEPHLGQPTALLFYGRQFVISRVNAEVVDLMKWFVILIGVYLIMDLAISITRRCARPRRKATRPQPAVRPTAPAVLTQDSDDNALTGGGSQPSAPPVAEWPEWAAS